MNHEELLKDAREMAEEFRIATRPHSTKDWDDDPDDLRVPPDPATCIHASTTLSTLAALVEAYDKAESEAVAVCILCRQDKAYEWEWLVGPPAGRPGEVSIPRTVYLCNHCVTVMKLGRPPVHRKGDAETQIPVDMAGLAAEAVAACLTCDEAIDALIRRHPVATAKAPIWMNLRAAGHLAKRVVELADKAKGGA